MDVESNEDIQASVNEDEIEAEAEVERQQPAFLAFEIAGASARCRGGSVAKIFKCAVRKFNKFLEACRDSQSPEVNSIHAELGGVAYDEIDKAKVTYKMLDRFASYLTQCGVKYSTASSYFSSIANQLNFDLTDANIPFYKINTKTIRDGLSKFFYDKSLLDQEPTTKSHETPTKDDVRAIIGLSILYEKQHPEQNLASFAFMITAMYQLAGRITETSSLTMDHITMRRNPDWHEPRAQELVAHVQINRSKTYSDDTLSIFCHRSDFLEDFYFKLAYSFSLRTEVHGEPNGVLFPQFYSEGDGNISNSQKKARSTASSLWSRKFAIINNLPGDFQDDQIRQLLEMGYNKIKPSSALTSHGQKRFAVQELSEHAVLNPLSVIQRVGWQLKNMHTIFDYLTNSASNDRQTAYHLSGWSTPDFTGRLFGGRPPLLDAIEIAAKERDVPHTDKVLSFDAGLYPKHQFNDVQRQLARIGTASILRYLPAFVNFLLAAGVDQPAELYSGYPDHPFISHLFFVAEGALIPRGEVRSTLEAWSKIIRKDFYRRNLLAAPFHELQQELSGEQVAMDWRDFQSFQLAVLKRITEQDDKMERLTEMNERLLVQNESLVSEVMQLKNIVLQLSHTLTCSNSLPQANLMTAATAEPQFGPPAATAQPDGTAQPREEPTVNPLSDCKPFPKSLKNVEVPSFIKDVYFYGWYAVFWPDYKHNQVIDKHVKSAARSVLQCFSLFLLAPIPPLPVGARNGSSSLSPEMVSWRNDLFVLVDDAWQNINELFTSRGMPLPKYVTPFIKNFKSQIPILAWPEPRYLPFTDYYSVLVPPDEWKEQCVAALVIRNKRKRDNVNADGRQCAY